MSVCQSCTTISVLVLDIHTHTCMSTCTVQYNNRYRLSEQKNPIFCHLHSFIVVMGNNNNQNKQGAASTDDVAVQSASDSGSSSSSKSSLSDISSSSSIQGPLGIDPLRYTEFLFSLLLIWILYLLVPRGLRVTYCGAYPKRYSWSSRIKRKRRQIFAQRLNHNNTTLPSHFVSPPLKHVPISGNVSVAAPSTYVSVDPFHIADINNYNNAATAKTTNRKEQQFKQQDQNDDLLQLNSRNNSQPEEELISFQSPPVLKGGNTAPPVTATHGPVGLPKPLIPNQDMMLLSAVSTSNLPPLSNKSGRSTPTINSNSNTFPIPAIQSNLTFTPSVIYPSNASSIAFHDEIAISTTMQRLRDVGVSVMAHGSKGKPKSVRLFLKENAIVWRTEIVKKASNSQEKDKLKVGKEHQVPLTDILYVDVGKQTTALRRMENASIDEALCFSLLTKEGSLDLESTSMEERDALVSCFSMILDEVHKSIGGEQGSWRDLYRAPSSDLPSSFDEYDMQGGRGNTEEGGGGSNSHNFALLEM